MDGGPDVMREVRTALKNAKIRYIVRHRDSKRTLKKIIAHFHFWRAKSGAMQRISLWHILPF